MLIKILNIFKSSAVQSRSFGRHNKKFLYKDGKKYENIIYYPRTPDQEDPTVIPSKLFRVQRIKPVKGNPYWEKEILKELGLCGKQGNFTVVKNIPENNARLWKIKHLIKVTPIVFPQGEPTENDFDYTFLKENGECIVTKQLVDKKRIEKFEQFRNDPNRLDGETLRKDSRLKWINPW